MLRIELRRDARKFLRRLPPQQNRRVARKIAELSEDPNPPDSKQLKGKASEYQRAAIGEYRIVYRVEGETLRVFLIGKRGDSDVYRRLARKLGR